MILNKKKNNNLSSGEGFQCLSMCITTYINSSISGIFSKLPIFTWYCSWQISWNAALSLGWVAGWQYLGEKATGTTHRLVQQVWALTAVNSADHLCTLDTFISYTSHTTKESEFGTVQDLWHHLLLYSTMYLDYTGSQRRQLHHTNWIIIIKIILK